MARVNHARPGLLPSRSPLSAVHRLQLVKTGRLGVEAGGRRTLVEAGNWLWLDGAERTEETVLAVPCRVYLIEFAAPRLPPPNFENRVIARADKQAARRCEPLLKAWNDPSVSPAVRLCRVQAEMLEILAGLAAPEHETLRVDQYTDLWWRIEAQLRGNLARPWHIDELPPLVRSEPAAITEACRRAVGVPPIKRLRALRMSMARSLVWFSRRTFTQIAAAIGYVRVHEFSRDYRKYFGVPPTRDRERAANAAHRRTKPPRSVPASWWADE